MSEHIISGPKHSVGSLMAASAILGAPISLRPPDHLVIIEEDDHEVQANREPAPPTLGPIKPPPFHRGVGPSRLTLWGDPLLETPQERVTEFGLTIEALVANLFGRLGGIRGYGLAAPQIGVNKAVAVIGMRDEKGEPIKLVLCNPVITQKGKKVRIMEGCLSIPGFFHTIERRHSVTVEYQNEKGEQKRLNAKGLLAQVIQHEVDHLQGHLMIEYVHERQAKRAAKRLVDDARRQG